MATKFVVVFALVVAVAQGSVVPLARTDADYTSFAYNVADPNTGDFKSQQETRVGGNVAGQYSLLDSDGTRRTVDYTADAVNGFNAIVRKDAAAITAPVAVAVPAVVAASTVTAPVVAARTLAAPVVAPNVYADSSVFTARTYTAPGVYAARTYAAPNVYAARTYAAPSLYAARPYAFPNAAGTYAAPSVYAAATPTVYPAPSVYATGAGYYASPLSYAAQPTPVSY